MYPLPLSIAVTQLHDYTNLIKSKLLIEEEHILEYLGLIAFIMLLTTYSNHPSKLKKLEKEIKFLKGITKGEKVMSRLIDDLKG